MAKWCSTMFQDAALVWLQNNVNKMVLLTATVSTINAAGCTATTYLNLTTLSTGSFTIANDTTNLGRKITIAAQATKAVNATGVAAHIALFSSATQNATQSATGIFYITSCTTQVIGSTLNKVSYPAWSITIQDPT